MNIKIEYIINSYVDNDFRTVQTCIGTAVLCSKMPSIINVIEMLASSIPKSFQGYKRLETRLNIHKDNPNMIVWETKDIETYI